MKPFMRSVRSDCRGALGVRLAVALAVTAFALACSGEEFVRAGAETAGSGGSGGSGGSDPGRGGLGGSSSCNWEDPLCAPYACATACPATMGDLHCVNACTAVVNCVRNNPGCGKPTDPMCVMRAFNGQPNVCTDVWDQSTGGMKDPRSFAEDFFKCVCRAR